MTALTCPNCQSLNREAARFCDSCGTPLDAGASAPRAVETPSGHARAADELKFVTVLFSDIVGSTEMIAGSAPDDARLQFEPVLQAMGDSVATFGGIVNRWMGDGVMALFGAPLSQEDHAVRACCAALLMLERAAALTPPIPLRVGIASGSTLLTVGDDEAAGAFLAFGATIHLAARLESMAEPGSALCSDETMRLAGASATMVSAGRHVVRGLPVEQELFRLTAIRRGALRFGSSVARGLSPFLGRDAALESLSAQAQAAARGGAVATLVGDAGIGKSRLAWEFARSLTKGGWQVLQAEVLSYERDFPYRLIIAVLRSYFGVEDADSAAEAGARVSLQLAQLGDPPAAAKAAVLSLLNLMAEPDSGIWDALEPLQRRNAIREGIQFLFEALVREKQTLLLLEDLHWADEESLRLLDQVAGGRDGLLLLATYRPGFETGWAHLHPFVLSLEPLPASEMARVVQEAFGDALDEELQGELVERSAGNPFFMEEMARAAMDARAQFDGVRVELLAEMPHSVQAVLAARIDRLRQDDKQVLRAASALGTRFPLANLQAIFADRTIDDLQSQLMRLRKAGLLRTDLHADSEEGFAHALIQEVAYQGLPRDRRRTLHAEIARGMKITYAERIGEHAETLAYHALQGEIWEDVAIYARQAGGRAASRSAYREAAAFFEQVILAYRHLPRSNQRLAAQVDVRFELRNALYPTAGISKALPFSQEAEILATQLGDKLRQGWALAFQGRDLTLAGRPGEAMAVIERAMALGVEDEELAVATPLYLALAAYARGEYAQAADVLRRLLTHVEGCNPMARYRMTAPAAVLFRGWLSWALARMGPAEVAEGLLVSDAMLRVAERVGQPLGLMLAHLSRGFVLAFADRLEEAREALRIALALCGRWDFYPWFTNVASCLGHVLARLGEHDEGIDLLEQAAERTRSSGILVSHANELAWLAQAQLLAGDPAAALRQAEAAVAMARAHEERGNEALSLFVLATVLGVLQRHGESADLYEQARRMADLCGMTLLAAQCDRPRPEAGCLCAAGQD